MEENRVRRHYRVAKKEIYEDPYEGIYVTKEEFKKFSIATVLFVLFSFLTLMPLTILKKK